MHGWSSTPSRDLIVYVLGISPDLPGFERVRIAPRPGPLGEAAGVAPTPYGLVEVEISGEQAVVSSPVPVHFVDPTGRSHRVAAGKHRVPMRRAQTLTERTPGNPCA